MPVATAVATETKVIDVGTGTIADKLQASDHRCLIASAQRYCCNDTHTGAMFCQTPAGAQALVALLENGAIGADEFAAEKAKILGSV